MVPDWTSVDTQGAGIAVAAVTGNGKLDVIVLMIDNAAQLNRGVYRVGRDLDADGNVTGGWSDWRDMPGWFSWDNQGVGVAVADTSGNGNLDIVVFGIDNPAQQNQAFYRTAFDVNADGMPAGSRADDPQAGWSSLLGVNNWFSGENRGRESRFSRSGASRILLFWPRTIRRLAALVLRYYQACGISCNSRAMGGPAVQLGDARYPCSDAA